MSGQPRRRRVVGMALYGDLTHDSRVRREAASLADAGFDVVIACLRSDGEAPDLPPGVIVQVARPSASRVMPGSPNPFFDPGPAVTGGVRARVDWLWGYVRNLRAWGRLAVGVVGAVGAVDIWHVHDLTGLAAVAPRIGRGTPLVYDAHELFLETGTARRLPGPGRRLLRAYERRLVRRASAVVTVNDALADILRRRYRPRRTLAVHSCPRRWLPPAQAPTFLRDAAGIPADSPVLLCHGALSLSRGIEQSMAALLEPGMESAHLALLGFGEMRDAYIREAAGPRWQGRVHVLDPVPPDALLDWVASADVTVMPIQPTTLNHRLSTPNKLFESLAAGVPVVSSDFPERRRIVIDDPDGPLGAVCDPTDPASIAVAIRSILEQPTDKRAELRARCLRAAHARWNWETQAAALVALYDELLGAAPEVALHPDPAELESGAGTTVLH